MNFFLKLFPFPEFLQLPIVGIDISDRSIKYAELMRSGSELKLKNFGYKGVEKEISGKGEIKNKEELIKVLKSLKQSLSNHYAAVSLPEEKVYLKVVSLPMMGRDKIRQALRVQLEELVPFSPGDVVFDFEVIKQTDVSLDVALTVFPKKIAQDYMEAFGAAGFSLVFFEAEGQSIFRALVGRGEKGSTMIIDFGKTRTSFIIGEKGFVKFSSTINVAGEHIDTILAKGLNVSLFEAEKIKRERLSLRSNKGNTLPNVMPVISVIRDEAMRFADYWQTYAARQNFDNTTVDRVLLCGGDCNIPGLADYLAHGLKIKVETGNPWTNITAFKTYVPEIERKESLRYVTVLGLAQRSFND